jgi:hypothetical protein
MCGGVAVDPQDPFVAAISAKGDTSLTRQATKTATILSILLAAGPVPTPAEAADTKFYPIEKFTIVSKLEGMRSGDKTVHARNWGNTRVEVEKTAMTMMGITQSEDKRVIIDGRDITTVDEKGKTVTTTVNPMYDNVAKSVEGKDGVELGRELMKSLGHVATGATGNYAGEACDVWSNASLGQELCVTSDGLVVYMKMNMMGMAMTETATEIRRGDGGPDSAFAVPAYPKSQVPNLGELMKRGKP